MNIDWSFLKLAIGSFVGMCLLAAYPLSEFATPEVFHSVLAGGIMSFLNLLFGYVVIEMSYEKSHTTFLKWVLGGMVVRLMLMWSAFLILLKMGFHAAALVLTLLFLYVLNLVLETYFLQNRVDKKSQAISS